MFGPTRTHWCVCVCVCMCALCVCVLYVCPFVDRLHYDKMMHLAGLYKTFARVLHSLLLLLSFVTIVCVSIQARVQHTTYKSALYNGSASSADILGSNTDDVADSLWAKSWPDNSFQILRYTIFGLAVLSTFFVGLWTFANPDARWHYLRANSAKIKTLIWHYRTRTGPFSHARADDADKHALADKILGHELRELLQHSVKSVSCHHMHIQIPHACRLPPSFCPCTWHTGRLKLDALVRST